MIQQINYPYISDIIEEYARNMLIKTTNIVRTDEEHFHLQTSYDLRSMLPHPENIYALNVYGEAMLLDYKNFNFTPQR